MTWFSFFFLTSTVISLQIGIFPKEKAYALRYQTAGMLENVLRQGVLGEDDIGEESPKCVLFLLLLLSFQIYGSYTGYIFLEIVAYWHSDKLLSYVFFSSRWEFTIRLLVFCVSNLLMSLFSYQFSRLYLWPCRNLKLPSRRPSIVCESCLYSLEKDKRVRAFHVMDPKGVIEMLLIFLEERGGGMLVHPSFDNDKAS